MLTKGAGVTAFRDGLWGIASRLVLLENTIIRWIVMDWELCIVKKT